MGVQCWFLLLAKGTFTSGYSRTGLGEWKPIADPMKNLHPYCNGHSVHEPIV